MKNVFVLGAGLGTRLRPLTESLPKPLVPVFNRPLINHAFDHLIDAGAARFIVNTHHRAEAYSTTFPDASYQGTPIKFRHEPDLLETGGGIANVLDLLDPGEPLVIYNGDILSDLPLADAAEAHRRSRCPATLVLRSEHPAKHIAFDARTGKIQDIRNQLGSNFPHEFGFTGIYFLDPSFLTQLPPVSKYSIIPVFLAQIAENPAGLGGVVIDAGTWWDLGDRDAYLNAHQSRLKTPMVAPGATIGEGADLSGATCIGAGCQVGSDAMIKDSVLWPGAEVAPGCQLDRCIVRPGQPIEGIHERTDF